MSFRNKIITKNTLFWSLLLMLLLLASYGQTLWMYFWRDDYSLLFKLQHPSEKAGHFGAGLIGQGAYQYLAVPYAPVFYLFGLNPFVYFLIGLLLYGIDVLAFYFFAKEVLHSKKASYISTLIFAAGYIAADGMFRIVNSWQNSIGVLLALLTLLFFVKSLRGETAKNYLLALLFYIMSAELVTVRSHSLILALLGLDLIYTANKNWKNKLGGLIIRQLPLWIVFRLWFLNENTYGAPGIRQRLTSLFSGHFEELGPLLANSGNVLIPDVLQNKFLEFVLKLGGATDTDSQVWIATISIFIIFAGLVFLIGYIWKIKQRFRILSIVAFLFIIVFNFFIYEKKPYWFSSAQTVISSLLFANLIVVSILLSIGIWRKNKQLALGVTSGWILVLTQVAGYYAQYPDAVFSTTHRYFAYAMIGYSLFWGAATSVFAEKFVKTRYMSLIPAGVVVLTGLFLNITHQKQFLTNVSLPSKQFYSSLINSVPNIQKGAAFYFDVADNSVYAQRFNEFFSVGSMPESTALAVYYGVDRYDVYFLTNYDELLYKLSTGEVKAQNLYTFFYGKEGLINTTEQTRKLLQEGSSWFRLVQRSQDKDNKIIFIADNLNPLTPMLLRLEMSVAPQQPPDSFPYFQTQQTRGRFLLEEKKAMLAYLAARKDYYNKVTVSSLSEWKFREVRNLIDQDLTTVWQGHRIWWHNNKSEQLTVDLQQVKYIDRFIWRNWQTRLTPTAYNIQVSTDGKTWKTVKTVENGVGKPDSELVIEKFDTVPARFVRMNIKKILSDDSPAIVEVEVIEAEYSKVNPVLALEFFKNPFWFVETIQEWRTLFQLLKPIAEAQISWKTDKHDNFTTSTVFPIKLDGSKQVYEIIIDAGGTAMEEISLHFSFPADISVNKAEARNLSFQQIKQRGMIKQFHEN